MNCSSITTVCFILLVSTITLPINSIDTHLIHVTSDVEFYGFRGCLSGLSVEPSPSSSGCYEEGNLAQTYSALLSLSILGDDLQRVDRQAVLDTVRKSQKEDGSFWSQGVGSECDMRFVFCAVSICHVLRDSKSIDWQKLGGFIRASFNYDGGIGQSPGDESHGGSTYCAIAALSLANHLWDESVLTPKELARMVKWAIWKQDRGFHGRAHKPDDSCYAFWIGATLKILNAHCLEDQLSLRQFLLTAQHQHMGGFCKIPEPGATPDLLHTYFSIAALSLLNEPSFLPVNPSLNVSNRAYENILHSQTLI